MRMSLYKVKYIVEDSKFVSYLKTTFELIPGELEQYHSGFESSIIIKNVKLLTSDTHDIE